MTTDTAWPANDLDAIANNEDDVEFWYARRVSG